jgi:hypothetical protein
LSSSLSLQEKTTPDFHTNKTDMVNIVENWAEVTGEITFSRRDPSKSDIHLVTVRIISAKNYESFPNLIRPNKQNKITIQVKREDIPEVGFKKGNVIKARVRAAGKDAYFFNSETIQVKS